MGNIKIHEWASEYDDKLTEWQAEWNVTLSVNNLQ